MNYEKYLKSEETVTGDIATNDAKICPITGKPIKRKKKKGKIKKMLKTN